MMMKSEVKMVIIGGGIIGFSIVYNFVKFGESDIVVFEKGYFGNGLIFCCGIGIR